MLTDKTFDFNYVLVNVDIIIIIDDGPLNYQNNDTHPKVSYSAYTTVTTPPCFL